MTQIEEYQIEDYVLHRYENVLLDHANNDGQLAVTITENDALNRDFFRTNYNESPCLASTIAMEILALGAIVSQGEPIPGMMAIFAGMLNVSLHMPLPMGERITGTTQKVSDKGGFIKYKGSLYCNDSCLAEGSILAFVTESLTTNDAVKKVDDPPKVQEGQPVSKDRTYKDPYLHMVDQYISDTETTCLTSYTFPETHPLIKGHFPGNPLMMGVLQWLTIEDACRQYARIHCEQAPVIIKGNAILFKADSSLVAEVKQFEVKVTHQGQTAARLTHTKRISFRQMVRPKDTVFTYLTDLSIE